MSNLKNKIYSSMVYLAKFYATEKVDSDRLKMYTEVLSEELTPEQLHMAIRRVVTSCRFFPSVAEIIELARPKADARDDATIIANEIIECVSRFGPYQVKEVKEYLGDKFFVAERFGWANLCAIQNSEIQSVRAQLRDLAMAYVNLRKKEEGLSQLGPSENKSEAITASPGLNRLNFQGADL
jgi:hypothetical protein